MDNNYRSYVYCPPTPSPFDEDWKWQFYLESLSSLNPTQAPPTKNEHSSLSQSFHGG